MNDKLKTALWDEAQTNGFNIYEYRNLLRQVNDVLNQLTMETEEARNGVSPNQEYDENGRSIQQKGKA